MLRNNEVYDQLKNATILRIVQLRKHWQSDIFIYLLRFSKYIGREFFAFVWCGVQPKTNSRAH